MSRVLRPVTGYHAFSGAPSFARFYSRLTEAKLRVYRGDITLQLE